MKTKLRDRKGRKVKPFDADSYQYPEWDKVLKSSNNVVMHHIDIVVKHCPGFNVAIQAGGAVGVYPKELAKFFQMVYTFEPSLDNFYYLEKNNMPENVQAHCFGLGKEKGYKELYKAKAKNAGSYQTGKPIKKELPIAKDDYQRIQSTLVVPIDSFIEDDEVDLIYLDIQGDEYDVLLGAERTIRDNSPMIAVEWAPNKCKYAGDVPELLKSWGYEQVRRYRLDEFWIKR